MTDTTDTPAKASKKGSKAQAAEAETETTSTTKGNTRPSAIVAEIDFDGVDDAALEQASARRSPWDDVLDALYNATADGKVGRQDDGSLKYVKIGSYASGQSAKAQVKAFTERKLTDTFDFKVAGTDLFARVIEVA